MSGQYTKSTEDILHEMSEAAEELKHDRQTLERIVAPVLEASEKLKDMEGTLNGYHLSTASSLRRALDGQASPIVAVINRRKQLEDIDAEEQFPWEDIIVSARREASIRQLIPDYGRPLLSSRPSASSSPNSSSSPEQFNLSVTGQEEDAHKARRSFSFLTIPRFGIPSLSPRSSTPESPSPASPARSPRSVKDQEGSAEKSRPKPKKIFTFNLRSLNSLTIPGSGLSNPSSPGSSASGSPSLFFSPNHSSSSITRQDKRAETLTPKLRKPFNLFTQSPDSDTLAIPITYGQADLSPRSSGSEPTNTPSSLAPSFYSITGQGDSSKGYTPESISSFESLSPMSPPIPRRKTSVSLTSPSPLETSARQRARGPLAPPSPAPITQEPLAYLDKIGRGLLVASAYIGMLGSLGLFEFLGFTSTWGLAILASSLLFLLLVYALDYYSNRPCLKELENYLKKEASQCTKERPLLNPPLRPSYNVTESRRFSQDQDTERGPKDFMPVLLRNKSLDSERCIM